MKELVEDAQTFVTMKDTLQEVHISPVYLYSQILSYQNWASR